MCSIKLNELHSVCVVLAMDPGWRFKFWKSWAAHAQTLTALHWPDDIGGSAGHALLDGHLPTPTL